MVAIDAVVEIYKSCHGARAFFLISSRFTILPLRSMSISQNLGAIAPSEGPYY